jgi:hypothetical protein
MLALTLNVGPVATAPGNDGLDCCTYKKKGASNPARPFLSLICGFLVTPVTVAVSVSETLPEVLSIQFSIT